MIKIFLVAVRVLEKPFLIKKLLWHCQTGEIYVALPAGQKSLGMNSLTTKDYCMQRLLVCKLLFYLYHTLAHKTSCLTEHKEQPSFVAAVSLSVIFNVNTLFLSVPVRLCCTPKFTCSK